MGICPDIGTATNSNNNPGWGLEPELQVGGWQWALNDRTNNINVNGPDGRSTTGSWHNFMLQWTATAAVAKLTWTECSSGTGHRLAGSIDKITTIGQLS